MTERSNVFILSLRQQVIFPAVRSNISIAPNTFTELCDFCEKHDDGYVGVVAVKPTKNDPTASLQAPGTDDFYTTGTYCRIASHAQRISKVGDKEVSMVTLSLEGQCRFQVQHFTQTTPFQVATIKLLEESEEAGSSVEAKAVMEDVKRIVVELLTESSPQEPGAGSFLRKLAGNSKKIRWPASPSVLADNIAAGLQQLSIEERQQVLETLDVQKRIELVFGLVQKAAEVQRLSKEINSKMQKRRDDELREMVLRRQMQELQREMRKLKAGKGAASGGEGDASPEEAEESEEEDDMAALRESLRTAHLSEDAQKIAQRELKRLQNIQQHHPEYMVCRTYLETLANLPWADSSKDDLDLAMAHDILEKDHYGLEKVKRRILEFLAVQKMRGDMNGPILCLHGPPGVGKTSLGRSIAKALGRKFHRIALGGVRDEAELRGHRRTYIGSMPGNIIQALMTLKVNNPVILLDEIDKLTRNAMFNPSGALLEVLDPEQNHTFKDHYVGTPFNLSRVLFVCTCNDLQAIDRPLLDRMEVIELSGYTVEEKVHIATTHLLPKQRRLHALEGGDPEQAAAETDGDADATASPQAPLEPRLLMTQAAIADLITKWTMETGVRSLERRVAQVCRWAALRLAGHTGGSLASMPAGRREEAENVAEAVLSNCGPDADGRLSVDLHHLPHIVGAEIFEPDLAERLTVGVAMGLGVSPVGGQLLFVEATRSKGSGRLTVTGQLGEVMRESVSTAISLLRSKISYASLAASEEVRRGAKIEHETIAGLARHEVAAFAFADAPVLNPLLTGGETQAVETSGKFRVFQDLISQADPTKDPFGNDDIHVHFPAGAIPKDGPSAGVTTTLALASLLLNRPVRSDTAVTGEITLRGHVLPVGGIRDKVLAAHRAGIRHVLLPYANQRHVKEDIPSSHLNDIELHYVKHIDEALVWAFAEDVKGWALASAPSSMLSTSRCAIFSKL
mmetsp:Transcript_31214/g.85611  ORF Transcript_31214/g.85611 Transcript_31214/m.85611 type:complete len:965 (+) Transcript_31214:75-2969(+)